MIRKILIANRGEIVNRIISASVKLDIKPVVIWTGSDQGLDYLNTPIEKHLLKGTSLAATYLNIEQIIAIARECGADAIHPGYGFLAENVEFARQCEVNRITWIGPSPSVMQKMSGKESSRQQAIAAGVPVLEAYSGTPEQLIKLRKDLKYPLLVKAISGGGGRGMRIIRDPSMFRQQVEIASREAGLFFGDPKVFVEEYISKAKHIEVQVIGDKHGNLVQLFERECTIQRRYQKIIEESPSPSLNSEQRTAILSDAVKLAKSAGYDSVGTLEFLLDEKGNHYFMEMNTRIQVEHPVSEIVTGIDMVAEQIRVASGFPLSFTQLDIHTSGHAIECRICAEDPSSGFDPRPGELTLFRYPSGNGIRIEHAIGHEFVVSPMYDSLIAKVIVLDRDRESALAKMRLVLNQITVHGVETTKDFIREVLTHQDFTKTSFYTDFISIHSEEILNAIRKNNSEPPAEVFEAVFHYLLDRKQIQNQAETSSTPWSTVGYWHQITNRVLECNGIIKRIESRTIRNPKPNASVICSMDRDRSVWATYQGQTYRVTEPALTRKPGNHSESGNQSESGGNGKNSNQISVFAPIPGMLTKILVKTGDAVLKGDTIAVIESMKTENQILAGAGGIISTITGIQGQQVKMNELLLEIDIK